jgi:hypothetical protein
MRSSILLILICTASLGCFCQAIKKYDIKDIHALDEVANKWEQYWNIHNIDSLATLFASDIDFVTKSGHARQAYSKITNCDLRWEG